MARQVYTVNLNANIAGDVGVRVGIEEHLEHLQEQHNNNINHLFMFLLRLTKVTKYYIFTHICKLQWKQAQLRESLR